MPATDFYLNPSQLGYLTELVDQKGPGLQDNKLRSYVLTKNLRARLNTAFVQQFEGRTITGVPTSAPVVKKRKATEKGTNEPPAKKQCSKPVEAAYVLKPTTSSWFSVSFQTTF